MKYYKNAVIEKFFFSRNLFCISRNICCWEKEGLDSQEKNYIAINISMASLKILIKR